MRGSEEAKAEGLRRKLVGLEIHDRAIARHGCEVVDRSDGRVIGHVTTGYRGISVDKSVAMAMIETPYAEKGSEVAVKVRKKTFPATVTAKKFYKKSYKNKSNTISKHLISKNMSKTYYSRTHEYVTVDGNTKLYRNL